jgi:beta-glucanase (GH16 family)
MYMLMNLAVGGTWPGSPTGASEFPQSFKIDYVRVYSDDAGVPEISGQSGYGVDSDTLEDITVDPEPAMGGVILLGMIYFASRRPSDRARKNPCLSDY